MFPRRSAGWAWAVWKCHPLRLTRARSFPSDDAIGLARPRGRSCSSDGLWDILRQEDQASARGQGDSRWLERRSVHCATGSLDCQENQSRSGAPHRSPTWFRSNPWHTESSTQPALPPLTPPPTAWYVHVAGSHRGRGEVQFQGDGAPWPRLLGYLTPSPPGGALRQLVERRRACPVRGAGGEASRRCRNPCRGSPASHHQPRLCARATRNGIGV